MIIAWLDELLPQLVQRAARYIEDSKEVLKVMHQIKWKKLFIQVTCDVAALYMSVPHDKAIMALSCNLCKYSYYTAEYIIMMVHFLLIHHYFRFECFLLTATRFPEGRGIRFLLSLSNLYWAGLGRIICAVKIILDGHRMVWALCWCWHQEVIRA